MQVMASSLGALAVAMIYYGYRDWLVAQLRSQCALRDRVTYMLWATARVR